MLTRALLRTKAAQVLYANFQSGNDDKALQNELEFSMKKTYDLYHFLLLLPIEITKIARKSVRHSGKKFLKTEEDKKPNTKLAENIFAEKLLENKLLDEYIKRNKLSWLSFEDQVQKTYSVVKQSDFYAEFMQSDASFDDEKIFWQKFYQSAEIFDEEFEEFLEELSIYWLDDLNIVLSFLEKTVERYKPNAADEKNILPLYKDDSDRIFIKDITRIVFANSDNYEQIIETFLTDWTVERLTKMDIVLIKMAIAEVKSFPAIPVRVTLNEYIEIAKFYGTEKSQNFINGVLDKFVKSLRQAGTLNKLDEMAEN
jgi:N utilization substance protein B